LYACGEDTTPVAEAPPVAATVEYTCGRGGSLKTVVFGAISAEIDWGATEVACEGMPRPRDEGARLRFAGQLRDPDQAIAFIIGLPDLERGATGKELATNATLILEGNGRFFSTAVEDACWTDITRQEPLRENRYAISGSMYCIAPLAEVNGDSSVTIEELVFSGLLDWDSQ
jgi:hypothetical protein